MRNFLLLNIVQRTRALIFLLSISAIIFPVTGKSQCPNDNVLETNIGSIPCGSDGFISIGAGTYVTLSLQNNATYVFRTCGSINLVGNTFDTELTGYDNSGNVLFYNDDNGGFCANCASSVCSDPGSTGSESYVGWTSTFSGTLNLLVDAFNISGCEPCTITNCPLAFGSAALQYRQVNNLGFTSSGVEMCSGQTRNLTAIPTGGTFSGTGVSGSVFTAPVAAGIYTITYTLGSCSATQQINVKSFSVDPTAINASSTAVCLGGGPTTLSPADGALGTNANWQWYTGSCGGTNIGSGPSINVTPVVNTTYFVRAIGDCNTTSCAQITITVNQPATVNSGGPDVLCQASNPAPYTLALASVGGGANTGAWSILSGGGSLSSTAQTATPSAVTYTPAANFNGTVTLELLTDDPDGAGPCPAVSGTRTITIDPGASAGAGGPDTVCQSSSPIAFVLSGSSVGGTASTGAWSVISGGGSLSDVFQTATPDLVTYTPAAGYTGNVFLQLTTDDPDGGGICTPGTSIRMIVVNPEATVDAGGPDAVCQSAAPVAITLSGATIGGGATTGTWSIISGGGTLSSTSPTATPAAETYTPAPNFNGVVTLQLITDAPVACPGATDTRTIVVYESPVVAPSNNSPVCEGDQINLNANASAGTPAYSYNWTGPASFSSVSGSPSLTNATLAMAGAYDVTVTDQNICSASGSTTVIVNPLPNGEIDSSVVVCAGSYSAIVLTFNLSVGTGPFDITYTDGTNVFVKNGVNNGDTIQEFPVVTTTYTLQQIIDNNGCVRNFGFLGGATVTVGPVPFISTVSVTDVLCNGGNTGTITITATGGTLPYTYSIDSGTNYQNNSLFTGVFAGSYNLMVSDVYGCSSAYTSNPVAVTEPPVLDHTTVTQDASCANIPDGSITITPTGGTPPYNYSLNGGPPQPGNAFTSLAAGTYDVMVIDFNNCTDTSQVVINNIYTVTAAIASQNDVSCFGGLDGAVTLQGSGGTLPYDYSINGFIFQPSPAFTGLASGNYVGIVRDVNGCTGFVNVAITQPNVLQAVVDSIQNVLCNGGNTGAIYITVNGGNGGNIFSWSNGAVTEDVTGLSAGTYTVAIVDSKGCSTFAGATLSEPLPLFVSVASYHNLLCFNDSSGEIDITANGGTPPYTFAWSNGAGTEDQLNLPMGTYDVTVTDANGCVQTQSQSLTEPLQLSSTISSTNAPCAGGLGGSVDLTVTGGTAAYSYLWNNGATTEDLPNVTSGTYSVVIYDNNGCSATNVTTVGGSGTMSLSFSVTDVTCNGELTGAIDLIVTGGTPTYVYLWNDNSTNEDLGALAAGNYSVTVTDNNLCTASGSATVSEPTALLLNAAVSNVTCAGANNGAVDLTVQGGVFPYTFLWSNASTTEDITGLSGGTYDVTVTDANLCTITASYTVTESTPIVSSVTGTNVTCFGANDGATDLTVSGGVSPYTFLWNTFQASEDLTGIGGGTFFVIITDANGCTKRDSVIITEPAAIVLTSSVTDLLCNQDSSAAIDLGVTGGVPSYTYLWSNGETIEDISNLPGGIYDVTVTDASVCSVTASFTITASTPIVSSVTGTNVTCFGANNGATDLIVSGGVPPYAFLWNTFQASEDLTGIGGGTFYVIIADATGCEKRDSVIITEPAAIVLTLTLTNSLCGQDSSAAIDLGVAGGTPTYTYVWSNGETIEDISNLPGGTYSVTVTDLQNCTASSSITIQSASFISINFIVHNPLCVGDANGSIDLIPTGGTPNYTFVWSNGPTTQNISGLSAGVYAVTITDFAGCTASDSTTVTDPALFAVSGTIEQISCFGSNDGAIEVTSYGGTVPYSYQWSSGPTTEDISNLIPDTYSVLVTDANACSASSLFVVSEPSLLVLDITTTNVSCFGGSNGTVSAVPSGGTPPYQYLWDDFNTDSSRTGVAAGHYSVMLTDDNGCNVFNNIDVTEPTEIMLSAVITDANCSGDTTGAIDLTVTGGTPGYVVVWSTNDSTEDLGNLSAGTYNVVVTDTIGCIKTADYTVTEPVAVYLTLLTNKPSCYGSNNGSVSVVATLGVPPYTYSWNTAPVQTAATAEDLIAGKYMVSVSDSKGCLSVDSITLTQPDSITITTLAIGAKCFQTSSGRIIVSATGGEPPYTYDLSGMIQLSDTFTGLFPGDYILKVEDRNGCSAISETTIGQPNSISVDLGATQQVILTGMETQLVATAVSDSPILNYFWSPDSVFNFTGCADAANCANPFVAPRTTTIFTVYAVNSDSCVASDTITIYVNNEPSKFIPTAFTPNNDNLNDRFEFDILGAVQVEVSIYNRWGEKVYHNPDQKNAIDGTNGWDGTKDGKAVPYDTYVYLIRATYWNDVSKNVTGTVTVMK